MWTVTIFGGLVNRTVLCLVLRVFSQALWQNWFLEVFETHFHCVGRLNTLSFPQLIVKGGWREDGATTDRAAGFWPSAPAHSVQPPTPTPGVAFSLSGLELTPVRVFESLGIIKPHPWSLVQFGLDRGNGDGRSRPLPWRAAWVCLPGPLPFFPRTAYCWSVSNQCRPLFTCACLYFILWNLRSCALLNTLISKINFLSSFSKPGTLVSPHPFKGSHFVF